MPFSRIGTATIEGLAAQLPSVPVGARRLGTNLVVGAKQPFIEDSWLGQLIRIGTGPEAVHEVFDRVIEGCVMVGMRQPGLAGSGRELKRIAQRQDNPLCLAIGGRITRPGRYALAPPAPVWR